MPPTFHHFLHNAEPALIAGLALIAACLVGALGMRFGRWQEARKGVRNAARARRLGASGEAAAARILKRRGYRVVDCQVAGELHARVDGRRVSVPIRADFLVTRRGKRWIAEAKATSAVATLTNRHTRRQLLEYSLAFDVAGVVLVDAERGSVEAVTFDLPRR